MGAKTCLVAQAQGDARRILAESPDIQETATKDFVDSLFPGAKFATPRAVDLSSTYLSDKSVVAGCFPGLRIIVAGEVAVECPSKLPTRFIAEKGTTILHAMHSVVDWLAFAVWKDGVLIRALSVAPDNGVIEDIGKPLDFENPFWRGERPAVDPEDDTESYPLPFHPLELGEEVLREFFGFQLEGLADPLLLEPESIKLFHFDVLTRVASPMQSKRAWWKLW